MTSTQSTEIRLLPLKTGSENEKLANLLVELISLGDATEGASYTALLILAGIQAFYDGGGNCNYAEALWKPIITYHELLRKFTPVEARIYAIKKAEEAMKKKDLQEASIYNIVAQTINETIESNES